MAEGSAIISSKMRNVFNASSRLRLYCGCPVEFANDQHPTLKAGVHHLLQPADRHHRRRAGLNHGINRRHSRTIAIAFCMERLLVIEEHKEKSI